MTFHVLRDLQTASTVLLAIQLGAILFPHACCSAILMFSGKLIYEFFKPDYETALLKGYIRPIIGMRLCWRCRMLRYWPANCRKRHFDNPTQLKSSGTRGCWLCQSVYEQLLQSRDDLENPPRHRQPEDLRTNYLLLWFAESTETSSGFLDHLRGKSYIAYIYGQHARPITLDPSSETSFDLVKEWVGRCNEEHSCYQGDKTPLPTRVIDVSAKEPRLFISHGHHAAYMTLSHCWGGKRPLITTIATIEQRCMGIPIASFPDLYRDAVTITRNLGIQYLWIDSLCILQDCKDDWTKEAVIMGDIYRLSYLTLYALSSPDCSHGILVQRRGLASAVTQQPNDSNSVEKTRAHIFKTAPLCQRAWALQERLLSPRLLFYSDGEMFWECLAHTAREGNHRIVSHKPTPYRYESYECPQVRIQLVRPLDDKPSFPVSVPSDWQIIVSEYSRCRLTYRSDKLPALSGLASMYRRNTGYTYIAGMWIENLADELLWFCPIGQDYMHEDTENVNNGCLEPSWSWISTDLAVRFKALGNHTGTWATDYELVQTVGSDRDPDDIAPSMLVIKAYFYRISLQLQPASRSCIILDGAGRETIGTGVLDATDVDCSLLRSCAAVVIRHKLPKRHRREYFGTITYFLIVVPAPQVAGQECWRRIGLAWTTRHLTSAPERSLVRLV